MAAPHTLDAASAGPAAVAGFLRVHERRAALLAGLLCGDGVQGDRALGAAFEVFVAQAPATAVEGWPLLFWTGLLQAPALNAEPLAPYWDGDFAPLARLDAGTRAVLLLRVVAGLDDAQAAAVFGVEPAEYRQALQRSLPQREGGGLDGEAWLALNDEARFSMQHLPPERVAAIARLREAAVAHRTQDPSARPAAAAPRWRGLGGLGRLWSRSA